jgi:hypothetical protein
MDSFYQPLLVDSREAQLVKNWLMKCSLMKDYQNKHTQKSVIYQVDQILQEARKNEVFRKKFFEVLEDADTGCGDRFAIILARLHVLYQVHCEALKTPKELAELLLSIHRRNLIDEIAEKKVENTELRQLDETLDPVEILLYYQLKLKEALKLPISTKEMTFPKMASDYVSEKDLEDAKTEILEKTTSPIDQANILIQSESWKERLRGDYPEVFDQMEQDLAQFDNALEETRGNEGELLEAVNKIRKNRETFILDRERELTMKILFSDQNFGKNEA